MPEFYLARQPIFDTDLNVIGYELLFRPGDQSHAGVLDGDQATSQVLLNTFTEVGLPKLVGDRRAFINLTRKFILDEDFLLPGADRIVLEILENVEVDNELIESVVSLSRKGYQIALDDFVFNENLLPLVQLADIIKLDLRILDAPTLRRHVEQLRDYPAKLLAEKVETPEELDLCRELGFDYFQGYFLCRPRNIKGKRLPANRLNTLQLVAALQSPATGLGELEQIIARDVTLSYKLLRYLNSAAFTDRQEITSIRHAIVYLGCRTVKNWASLIALANIDDKPVELITTSLVRGKMCELLTDALGENEPQSAFTVGMFSVLDAMLDTPLPKLMQELPFAGEISDALLHHQGPYGQVLHTAIAYDRGEWEQLSCTALESQQISDIYLSAVEWARKMLGGLTSRPDDIAEYPAA